MKKILLIIGGSILFLLIALAIVPFIFKDKIIAKVNVELAKNINADIVHNSDKFSLSIFRNFPKLTISIGDFVMVAKQEEFRGDTLFSAESMSFAANIMSVISGDKIEVNSIYLSKPLIATYTSKTGVNSWSTLAIPDPADTVMEESLEPSEFKIAFDKWEIEDGRIIYDDASLPMYASLSHVNHTGGGDLTQEVVDINTITKSSDVYISYDNITYMKNHTINAEMNLNMNYVKGEYRFLENEVSINKFKMGFDGFVAMPNDAINMDIKFKAKETEFKNILSLIPEAFLKDFEKIKTEGVIGFDGYVKGTMDSVSTPGYGLNLKINNAMMKYPDLPTAVTNISTDLSVDNKDGTPQNMIIDIKQFHMDLGKNPIDAKILVKGMEPYDIDANIVANVNLSDITTMFPIDETTLKGNFSLDAKAKGEYSDTLKLMPVVDAKMSMQNGYVKTKEVPAPLENINFTGSIASNGEMSDTKIWINNFKMQLENEPFEMNAFVQNLSDASYDVAIKGVIDLTKITKMYPLEDMTVAGKILADIKTKGVMSDIEAGRYDKTSTQGTMDVSNLKFTSKDMPQGLSLSTANFSFTPERMMINNMKGNVGKSDIDIKGYFANYMGYMFGKKDTTIRGSMTLQSNMFDANEWLTDDEEPTSTTTQESSAPFEVPRNIDFVFASTINTVHYTNMTLKNLKGNIIMKDGIVRMDKLMFNTLGGDFFVNGSYNSQNLKSPKFTMDMDMSKVKIAEAYLTFNSIQKLAPVAKDMEGDFSMIVNMDGILDKEMMPVYSTLTGSGKTVVESAKLEGSKALSKISDLTKINGLNPLVLKDIIVKFKIADGKLLVDPFDLNSGNVKMNIGGTNGLDGSMDYLVKMDVPTGALGNAVGGALTKLTGKNISPAENLKMNFNIGGTTSDPNVSLASSSSEGTKTSVKEAVVDRAKDEIKNNAQVQKAKEDLENAKKEAEEKVRAEAERIKKETEEKAKKEAEDAIKNKIKKKLPF